MTTMKLEKRSCSQTGMVQERVPMRSSAPRAAPLATMAPVNLGGNEHTTQG